ncbi:hypothetical protein KKH27_03070 [bacterium]|nr:hypothetical protein [bacterium]MBU1983047.1 hypothetical protein [bacterium]
MLGKVLEATVRLNVYLRESDGHVRSITADAWGFSQVTGRKVLVVRDLRSQVVHVLGHVVRRSEIPQEDLPLMMRARVVEESVTSSGRSEWEFYLEEVDLTTKHAVLRGPLIEPASIVGGGIRL